MSQERLRNLAILPIEHSMVRNFNFDIVINIVAEQEAQKKEF